jgi:hypothetical protein
MTIPRQARTVAIGAALACTLLIGSACDSQPSRKDASGTGAPHSEVPLANAPILLHYRTHGETVFAAGVLEGVLAVSHGCVGVHTIDGQTVFLVLPDTYSLSGDSGGRIVDGSGHTAARFGAPIRVGGGYQRRLDLRRLFHVSIPPRCGVATARFFLGAPGSLS